MGITVEPPVFVATPRTYLERQVAHALDTLGLRYEEQVWLGGRYQVDFLLRAERVVIEANGCTWHGHFRCGRYVAWRWDRDERRERYLVTHCGIRHVVPIWGCDVGRVGAAAAVRGSLARAGVLAARRGRDSTP